MADFPIAGSNEAGQVRKGRTLNYEDVVHYQKMEINK